LGTRNPHGYGFGQNFIPVTGMGFLAGVFFLRGYGFGQVIPSEFLPIAISTPAQAQREGAPCFFVFFFLSDCCVLQQMQQHCRYPMEQQDN
jgi:hypothetical protein